MAKILVVDDQPDIILIVSRILKKAGHDVIGAGGGQEALDILRRMTPDLILLDIMMPYLDGWETLELIRREKHLKDVPVSMLTAKKITPEIIKENDVGELVNYIEKPFTKESLTKKVEETLLKLADIEKHSAELEGEEEDINVSNYKTAAKRELIHRNLSLNLKDILSMPDTEEDTNLDEIHNAIKTQEKMIDVFRKKREEILKNR